MGRDDLQVVSGLQRLKSTHMGIQFIGDTIMQGLVLLIACPRVWRSKNQEKISSGKRRGPVHHSIPHRRIG